MSAAYDVALRLQAQGVGVVGASSGWSISVSREPIAPATAITVYDTGGGPIDTDEQNLESPTIQVRVRGVDYAAAYAKQQQVRDALIFAGFSVTGRVYISAASTSGILAIGRDDADRFLLTQNFQLLCETD